MSQADSVVWHFRHAEGYTAQCTVTGLRFGSRRWALCLDVNAHCTVEWFPTREAALDAASAIASVMQTHGWRQLASSGRPHLAAPRIGANSRR